MSTYKTNNLNLHKWAPTDYVKREEFNDNFDSIDASLADDAQKELNILSYKHLKNGDDWTLAFNQAQADCPTGGKIVFPKNTYKGEFNITKSIDIDFRGSKLIPTGLDKNIINITGSRNATNYILSNSRLRGQKDLPLTATPTDLFAGDLIVLVDDTVREGGLSGINIEVHKVKSVSGNTLILEDFVRLPKTVSTTSNVYKISTIKDINLENLECEGLDGATASGGINAMYVENVSVKNFKMSKNRNAAVSFRTSYNCVVDGFDVKNPIATAGAEGYGVIGLRGTVGLYVRNGLAKGMRHAVDCAEVFDSIVENVIAHSSPSTAFVLSHNSFSSDITFKDCKAFDSLTYGFQISSQGAPDPKIAYHYNIHLVNCEVEFAKLTTTDYAIGVYFECPVKNSTIDVIVRYGDGTVKPVSTDFARLDGVRTTANGNDLKVRLRAYGLINAVLCDTGDYTTIDKETDNIALEDVIIENCTNAFRFKNVYSTSIQKAKIKNVDTLFFNYYDSTLVKLRHLVVEDILLDGYTTFTSYDFSTIAHANGILGSVKNVRRADTLKSGSISVESSKAFTMEEILTSRHGETLKIIGTAHISLNTNPLPNGWFIGQRVTIYSQSGVNITIPKGSNMFTFNGGSIILGATSLRAVSFEWNGSVWMQLSGIPNAIASIAAAPLYVGQEALVSGVWYKAIGTSATTDWKQITN